MSLCASYNSLILPGNPAKENSILERVSHLRYNEYTQLVEQQVGDGTTKLVECKNRVLFHIVCSGIPSLRDRKRQKIPPWIGVREAVRPNRTDVLCV